MRRESYQGEVLKKPPELLKVVEFCQRWPGFKRKAMYRLIWEREVNGLNEFGAIVQQGRSVFILPDVFFKWLNDKSQKGEGNASTGKSKAAAQALTDEQEQELEAEAEK